VIVPPILALCLSITVKSRRSQKLAGKF